MALMIATAQYEDEMLGFEDDTMVLERRNGVRTKISRPLKVVELASGRHIAGRSRDVSSTGMRLEIPITNNIQEGDTIHVDVGTLSGIGPLANRPRVIPARVVWIEREHKLLRPLLTAGIEFAVDLDACVNVA